MSEVARLVEREIPRLRRFAIALTRDHARADDLVQSCLTQALAKLNLWQPGTDMRAWLFTMLHNLHINDVRRLAREDSRREIAMVLMTPAPRTPDARLELHDFEREIGKLPESQRHVLLLVGLEGMSYGDVAAILGVPIGTVRSRLARAREALRTRLHRPPIRLHCASDVTDVPTPPPTESALADG